MFGGTFTSAAALALAIVVMSPIGAGATNPSTILSAPYKGGVLPTSSLSVYGCNAHANLIKPWHFSLVKGIGGGYDSVNAKACNQSGYRLGSQSQASASGSEEVSILIHIPHGIRNVTAHLTISYTGIIKESSGTVSSACPTTPFDSTSASYYNGSSWSYTPTISHPLLFNNKTYYYSYRSDGASGSCASTASLDAGVIGFMVASNGLAGYSLTPTVFQFGGFVATYNSTYWSCYNYTLWSYGTWSNASGGCYSSNRTAYSYSYDYQTATYGTNSSMAFTGTNSLSMWSVNKFAAVDRSWSLFIEPFASMSCNTYGFPHGSCIAAMNLATGGNAVTLKSISIT